MMIHLRRDEVALTAIIAIAAVLTFALVADNLPLREVIILAYLAVGPGAAIVWLARITDRAMQLSLVVPLSLAVDALVATGLLYAGIWSPTSAFAVVAAITLASVLLGVRPRTAVVPLVALALLPSIVLLMGQF